jgi:hypothetical protein
MYPPAPLPPSPRWAHHAPRMLNIVKRVRRNIAVVTGYRRARRWRALRSRRGGADTATDTGGSALAPDGALGLWPSQEGAALSWGRRQQRNGLGDGASGGIGGALALGVALGLWPSRRRRAHYAELEGAALSQGRR